MTWIVFGALNLTPKNDHFWLYLPLQNVQKWPVSFIRCKQLTSSRLDLLFHYLVYATWIWMSWSGDDDFNALFTERRQFTSCLSLRLVCSQRSILNMTYHEHWLDNKYTREELTTSQEKMYIVVYIVVKTFTFHQWGLGSISNPPIGRLSSLILFSATNGFPQVFRIVGAWL